MTAQRLRAIWIVVALAWMAYLLMYYRAFPAEICIGWTAGGEPKDWADRDQFMVYFIGGSLAANLVLYWLSGSLIRRIPVSILSLPWKEYWFASPVRRDTAYDKLRLTLILAGIMLNLIQLLLVHSIIQTNTDARFLFIPASVFIGIVFSLVIAYLVQILAIFKPVREISS